MITFDLNQIETKLGKYSESPSNFFLFVYLFKATPSVLRVTPDSAQGTLLVVFGGTIWNARCLTKVIAQNANTSPLFYLSGHKPH